MKLVKRMKSRFEVKWSSAHIDSMIFLISRVEIVITSYKITILSTVDSESDILG